MPGRVCLVTCSADGIAYNSAMNRPTVGTREGDLLLADISGYTPFFASTELEHAQDIIRELTTLIRERLAPPMRFVKREGDAVFCFADAATFREGERLVELIEACYFDFSNRLLDMSRERPAAATAAPRSARLA